MGAAGEQGKQGIMGDLGIPGVRGEKGNVLEKLHGLTANTLLVVFINVTTFTCLRQQHLLSISWKSFGLKRFKKPGNETLINDGCIGLFYHHFCTNN